MKTVLINRKMLETFKYLVRPACFVWRFQSRWHKFFSKAISKTASAIRLLKLWVLQQALSYPYQNRFFLFHTRFEVIFSYFPCPSWMTLQFAKGLCKTEVIFRVRNWAIFLKHWFWGDRREDCAYLSQLQMEEGWLRTGLATCPQRHTVTKYFLGFWNLSLSRVCPKAQHLQHLISWLGIFWNWSWDIGLCKDPCRKTSSLELWLCASASLYNLASST